MGRESAHWLLDLTADEASGVVHALDALGVERAQEDRARSDFLLRDPHRFWIDLRVHRTPATRLEVRIALTNDTWSIRAPLERALTPLAPTLGGRSINDEDGTEIAAFGADGWSLALEDDYARLRDAFIARVGDFNAPISADHVYMYVHQTRWNRDNDDELAWHREREIARIEEMWEGGSPDAPRSAGADPVEDDEP
jgi:hypothetical protein